MTKARIESESDSRRLARALLDPDVVGHAVTDPQVIETHISFVVLTGAFAYKLRKPVRLPFLDFRTLDARRDDCERELSLNRRWAPGIYEQIVVIHGDMESPSLRGTGPVLDYAVKMRQFPHDARLDRVITAHGLGDELTDALARTVADLHEAAPVAGPGSGWSTPRVVQEQIQGNLDALAAGPLSRGDRDRLEQLSAFSLQELDRLEPEFLKRLTRGKVRECHGDLHLANLVFLDGKVVPFDGVEFRADFRWVDIISDLAFLLMDLEHLGHTRQARRLLNTWLELTGDHEGLALLRHYLVYRALVRAKVAMIRHEQMPGSSDPTERTAAYGAIANYLELAHRMSQPGPTQGLIITHGVSGSGKTHVARQLVPVLGAVMLRSDVERKRLHPDPAHRYSDETTTQVYRHLLCQGEAVLSAGYPLILDATFLDRRWRDEAAGLATRRGVPFRILSVSAPRAVLESRVRSRRAAGTDASEADLQVLAAQMKAASKLDATEHAACVPVDSSMDVDPAGLGRRLRLQAGP